MPIPVVVFEDAGVPLLSPITETRPAFAIRCGGWRLIDLLAEFEAPLYGVVRPHLQAVTAADFPQLSNEPPPSAGPCLAVNARLVPCQQTRRALSQLLNTSAATAIWSGEHVVAARTSPASWPASSWAVELAAAVHDVSLEQISAPLPLLEYAHDVIRWHLQTLAENLQQQARGEAWQELTRGLFVSGEAQLHPSATYDTEQGPILLHSGCRVGPHAHLRGPLQIGHRAQVLPHALLESGVDVAAHSKLGGEVAASIVEAYSNKQHFGYLGHSYLGSWVNLGAGTSNSDLKNTYGPIHVDYDSRRVATEMQFLGTIIGDYAKTAIHTAIYTGKRIGVGSMAYGLVSRHVPSFVNHASQFGQVTEVPVDVLVTIQSRMFARRGVTQRPCDIQLLHDLFQSTAAARARCGVERGKLSL